MKVFTYSEARQRLSALLDQATRQGVVQIRRRDGRLFVVKPVEPNESPLDVPPVTTDVTTAEIVEAVRESRRRGGPGGSSHRSTRPAGRARGRAGRS